MRILLPPNRFSIYSGRVYTWMRKSETDYIHVYHASKFSTKSVCYSPVSSATNVEKNEIRIEKNNSSGHIPLAFVNILSVPLSFVSHYSVLFSVRGTYTNKKEYRIIRHERWGNGQKCHGMWEECDPNFCSSLSISHDSLHSWRWNWGITILSFRTECIFQAVRLQLILEYG